MHHFHDIILQAFAVEQHEILAVHPAVYFLHFFHKVGIVISTVGGISLRYIAVPRRISVINHHAAVRGGRLVFHNGSVLQRQNIRIRNLRESREHLHHNTLVHQAADKNSQQRQRVLIHFLRILRKIFHIGKTADFLHAVAPAAHGGNFIKNKTVRHTVPYKILIGTFRQECFFNFRSGAVFHIAFENLHPLSHERTGEKHLRQHPFIQLISIHAEAHGCFPDIPQHADGAFGIQNQIPQTSFIVFSVCKSIIHHFRKCAVLCILGLFNPSAAQPH